VKPIPGWARRLLGDVVALWFCVRHPRSPLIVKILAGVLVAYALSPIDLIPDFIPVLGLLDEAIVIPAGIWVVMRLVPPDVMAECREQAARWVGEKKPKPRSYFGAALVVSAWLIALTFVSWLVWRWLAG
jgi:uncharacterized membrane protein YkvA (DUF1232 family)